MPRWSLLDRWRRGEIGLSIALALQITVMFAVAPLASTGVLPPVLVEVFRVGLALAAVLLVSTSRKLSVVLVLTFLASVALSSALTRTGSDLAVDLERLAATAVFDLALMAVVAGNVFRDGRVTVHRIMGAVVLYLSIGLVFATAYRACALLLHPSFSNMSPHRVGGLSLMLYFSLSTLTTTGFGDIAPVHPFVRSLANLEAVVGQLFPATLLARLVTLHVARETAADQPAP